MARKYSKGASKKVERAMHERKEGTLKSGRSGKKVPKKKTGGKKKKSRKKKS